jgi:hypothetical protein
MYFNTPTCGIACSSSLEVLQPGVTCNAIICIYCFVMVEALLGFYIVAKFLVQPPTQNSCPSVSMRS